MALNEQDIETLTGSQEQFETYVREHLRQAVRVALMNERKSVETSAMDITHAHRTRAWDQSRIYPSLELVMDIKHRCLNAIIVVVRRWIRQ